MKYNTLFLSGLLALLGLAACRSGKEYVEPTLDVSPTTIEMSQEVGTGSFTLSTNREWSIASSSAWISVTPTSGAEGENQQIQFTVMANETEQPREAVLTVKASSLSKTVTIQQKGKTGAAISFVTIAELLKKYADSGVTGETYYVITEDLRLKATCIFDLAGGNSTSLKNAYLQDETGGLAIRTDKNNGYTAGDQVTVKLKDAYMFKYKGVGEPQLNFNTENASAEAGSMPAPKEVTIDQIVTEGKYHSIYCKVKGVEFVKYKGLTYHDTTGTATATSRPITSCTANTVDVRTSKYAAFAGDALPQGKGDLLGIVTKYQYSGGDVVWQLLLSNATSDDAMSNDPATRCSGTGSGNIPESATKIALAEVVKQFADGGAFEGDHYIEGQVLLNPANGNIPGFVVYVADETAGMALTLSDDQAAVTEAFPVGALVQVYIKGAKYKLFNGLVQLGDGKTIACAQTRIAEAVASHPLAAKEVKITDLTGRAYQGEWVKIQDVQFSESGKKYGDKVYLQDRDNNTVQVYTRSNASFAGDAVPSGSGTFYGVVSCYNAVQLILRNPNELSGMTGERFKVSGGEGDDSAKATLVSIKEVRALTDGDITANIKIKGVVTSDNAKGNMATGNMYVQDADGAIALRFTTDHAVAMGQEIEVWLQGTNRNTFNGLAQVQGIPVGNILSRADGTLPTPKEISVAELNTDHYQAMLVKLPEVQFKDISATYSGSQTLVDRSGAEAVVYTRSGCSFADRKVAQGSGPIIGIASVFKEAKQLLLRTLDDASGMTAERFESGGGDTPTKENAIGVSIAKVRALAPADAIGQNWKIKGVVTSDIATGNMAKGNLYLQDAEAGIMLRFPAGHQYALGTELEVWIYGAKRENYSELDQVNNLTEDFVISSAAGTLPAPAAVSVEQLLSGQYESLLVKVADVQFEKPTATYKDSPKIQGKNGKTVTVYTRGAATFANETVAQGSGPIVGIASVYNGEVQLVLRSPNDAAAMTGERFTPDEGGSGGGTSTAAIMFSEYVEGSSNNKYLELYNPGTEPATLNGWFIKTNTNGLTAKGWSNGGSLDGITVPAKGVVVLKHSKATVYSGEAKTLSGDYGLMFNGNDPVGLFNGTTLVDIIGVYAYGGSTGGNDFAKDVSLRRKSVVKGPYVSDKTGWDPSQWEVYNKDDVSGLGSHTVDQ